MFYERYENIFLKKIRKRSDKLTKIIPPCTYQGSKQRVVKEIVDLMFENSAVDDFTKFYDLCAGAGTISLELISRGVSPSNIIMLDKSSWGLFWHKIGNGEYDIEKFNYYINNIPKDKHKIQSYLKKLSEQDSNIDEEYVYILLQSGAFGGKQIWKEDGEWKNASFRSYWQPTENSKRRSPVNPMQPMPETIKKRMEIIIDKCKGLTCFQKDIYEFLEYIRFRNTENCIIYIDPPYKNTTKYGFTFDWEDFISELFNETLAPIYVSECQKYSDEAFLLNFNGGKGGISGNKIRKNEEWLNIFN
jgi:16S rRNA G966 N2-methylase RsmD